MTVSVEVTYSAGRRVVAHAGRIELPDGARLERVTVATRDGMIASVVLTRYGVHWPPLPWETWQKVVETYWASLEQAWRATADAELSP